MIDEHLKKVRERHADSTSLELALLAEESRIRSMDESLSSLAKEAAQAEAALFETMSRESKPAFDAQAQADELREHDVLSAEALQRTIDFKAAAKERERLQKEVTELQEQPEGILRNARLTKAQAALDNFEPPVDALKQRYERAAELKQMASEARASGDNDQADTLQREQYQTERGLI